jgi:hypothetical protein
MKSGTLFAFITLRRSQSVGCDGTEFAREKTLFLIGYMAEKFQQITAVANRELSIRAKRYALNITLVVFVSIGEAPQVRICG